MVTREQNHAIQTQKIKSKESEHTTEENHKDSRRGIKKQTYN
jgi:hypothetical protein